MDADVSPVSDAHEPEFLTRLGRLFPAWQSLKGYNVAALTGDISAGLVVALVVIPSAISYADLAHCSPVSGLYAALGGMIAYALFASSRHVVAGPDAAIAILVGATVGPMAEGDPGRTVALATWLALLAAVILMAAAWLRLGAAADFLSAPVMLGFMNGAAVVILVSQLGKLSGIKLHQENSLMKLLEWLGSLGSAHALTLALGLAGVAALAGLRRGLPKVPGSIIVFAIAMIAGRCIDFTAWGMQVIGTVDTRLPSPVPPELSLTEIGRLVVAALGLAMLVFPEGVLLGRAVASRKGYEIDPNRELVALSLANLAAGLFRSFSVGASQSRTLLSVTTGGRTPLVSVFASGLLVAFVVLLAPWIATLPTVAIASILVYTAITLIDVTEYRRLRGKHRASARLALFTSIGVVAFGVLPGILVGVVLSLLRLIRHISHPPDSVLGRAPGQSALVDRSDDPAVQSIPGLVVYRFLGPLVFANARYFIARLGQIIAGEPTPVRHVILDARAITDIDVTAAEELQNYGRQLRERGISIAIAKANRPLRRAALRLGLDHAFAEGRYFPRLSDAVAEFERRGSPPVS
ncbi:MAG: SulP family inorganic anion transporter [Gemmataceae bacterium]|nr:SulP family inorganic anion transporter [Gemmataceae bacterium]